jgi:hypothetical protein
MTTLSKAKDHVAHGARKVGADHSTERLELLGYFVRGLVYLIPGLLALQMAFGMGGAAVTSTGAIQLIGAQPFGKILLVAVAIGLAGYSLWGLIRATLDPFHEGDDAMGLAVRFGYIVSAIGYAVLVVATVQSILGIAVGANNPQDWTAALLQQPLGRMLVGIVGLIALVFDGLYQIYQGYKADFKKDLKTRDTSATEKKLAILLGRLGYMGRGVVYALIGVFLVQAAVLANPAKAKGFDGALLALATSPYGPWLLGVVALGLIAFGVYSILCVRWMKVEISRT